jgi:DNA-binding transcriptional LysR family regulator
MVAVRLTRAFRVLVVGSPAYLKRVGKPKSLGDLRNHNCIQHRLQSAGGLYRWELKDGAREVQVETRGTVIVNDMAQAVILALESIGLCYTFEPLVRPYLDNGRLDAVLPTCAFMEDGLSLYFPRRASMAPKLRAFIDTARDVLQVR